MFRARQTAPEIPFNRPSSGEAERRHLEAALESGPLAGLGPMGERCESLLQEELGAEKVLITPSGTQALEMAALLLDLPPGSEVICPSFTHPSTVNAFVLRGARPVFCDVRSDTLDLDEDLVEALVSRRTVAIACTHYGGVGCEMDRLLAIGERHGIELVEDNSHGLFAGYRGQPLGTFGRFGALSFHETKNVSCGEGGALVINRAADVSRAERIRDKGTDRARFARGEVEAYSWTDLGSSYLPSELQAAYLRGQLERADQIQAARHRIWSRYAAELADWAGANGVRLPRVPADRSHPAHLFHLCMPGRRERDGLIEHLGDRGILAVFHYQPLHLSRMGRRLAPDCPSLPETEAAAESLVRLPLFTDLTDQDQSRVIDAVITFSA